MATNKRKAKNDSILNFFPKVSRKEVAVDSSNNIQSSTLLIASSSSAESTSIPPELDEIEHKSLSQSPNIDRVPKTTNDCIHPYSNDIGLAANRTDLSDDDRRRFLESWKPEKDSDFPSSIHKKSGKERIRRLLPQHLKNFPWLTVSKVEGLAGAFCIPCVLFMTSLGVGGRSKGHGQCAGKLVSKPLDRYDDLTGKHGALSAHQATEYHKSCILAMENFRNVLFSKQTSIKDQLVTANMEKIKQNRQFLEPIVDTILTCGRQNIALRGSFGETGSVNSDAEPISNDGNFRALLRYRARGGDPNLLLHLKSAQANATYQSASIQNELIKIAGTLVKEKKVLQILRARCWAIIADETMDRQRREQLAVCIRYVMKGCTGKWEIHEDPIAVVDLISEIKSQMDETNVASEVRLSGAAIGETLLRKVQDLGLDLEKCIAQGYDGATAMASSRVGAATVFKEKAAFASYFHCAMHCLNLSASEAIKIPEIRHTEDVVRKISKLFRSSPKCTNLLKTLIDQAEDTRISKKHLTTLCTTRFIERHTAIVTLRQLLPFVISAFETMKTWSSIDIRQSAQSLKDSVCQSDFIVGLVILETISGILLPLTRALQCVEIDLIKAIALLNDTQELLQCLRTEEKFSKMFREMELLADFLDVRLRSPRTSLRSVYRPNAIDDINPNPTAESYYRINYFFPSIDAIIQDLMLRFGERQRSVLQFTRAIPAFLHNSSFENNWSELWKTFQQYDALFADSLETIKQEYQLWTKKWEDISAESRPRTAIETLDHCSEFFPNMTILLELLACLPVTTAQAERVFSKLENTLTAIRSTMTEDRLESLLFLQIHRECTPSVHEVIDRFASTAARRLNFLL